MHVVLFKHNTAATQIVKNAGLDKRWLPLVAVGIGTTLGLIFGIYYSVDLLEHIVSGDRLRSFGSWHLRLWNNHDA